MRLLIVANSSKPAVPAALQTLLPELSRRVQVVGVENGDSDQPLTAEVDAVLVLGGDGTLLSVARRLGGGGVPILGVNFGRLGFLASFTPSQFNVHLDAFVAGKLPISSRATIETSVLPAGVACHAGDPVDVAGRRRFVATALNDAVVTAGDPFHMILLEVGADDEPGVRYFGDGVIVSTASGSTAYNVSAGGPIVSPTVDAFCITPVCPHSLSFRPMVISGGSTVAIFAARLNEGTRLYCDGQVSTRLHMGEKIIIRRSPHSVRLIENPDARRWRTLAQKLGWASSPAEENAS